jgi:hypothetical protein
MLRNRPPKFLTMVSIPASSRKRQPHITMAQGSKSSYSSKQKRMAAHIEKSYKKRGVSSKEAGERAWRTVNKETGGAKGKKGRKSSRRKSSARRKTSRKRSK